MITGVAATVEWLVEVITADAVEKKTGEFVIPLEDGKLALIVPEELAVYLITVQAAQFVPTSNAGTEPK